MIVCKLHTNPLCHAETGQATANNRCFTRFWGFLVTIFCWCSYHVYSTVVSRQKRTKSTRERSQWHTRRKCKVSYWVTMVIAYYPHKMNLNSFVQFVICRMWKHFACQQPLDLHPLWRPLSTEVTRTCVCDCMPSNSCLQISLNREDVIVCGDASLPENVQLSDWGPVANKICCSRATGWREERVRRVQRCWTAHSKSSREGHRCSLTGTNLRQCGWENIVRNQFVRCRIPFALQEFTSTF